MSRHSTGHVRNTVLLCLYGLTDMMPVFQIGDEVSTTSMGCLPVRLAYDYFS